MSGTASPILSPPTAPGTTFAATRTSSAAYSSRRAAGPNTGSMPVLTAASFRRESSVFRSPIAAAIRTLSSELSSSTERKTDASGFGFKDELHKVASLYAIAAGQSVAALDK